VGASALMAAAEAADDMLQRLNAAEAKLAASLADAALAEAAAKEAAERAEEAAAAAGAAAQTEAAEVAEAAQTAAAEAAVAAAAALDAAKQEATAAVAAISAAAAEESTAAAAAAEDASLSSTALAAGRGFHSSTVGLKMRLFLSLELNETAQRSHKKCSCQAEDWTSISPSPPRSRTPTTCANHFRRQRLAAWMRWLAPRRRRRPRRR